MDPVAALGLAQSPAADAVAVAARAILDRVCAALDG